MKRDMDLIRKLLMQIEALDEFGGSHNNLLEGYSQAEIGYHAYLLVDSHLAEGCDSSSSDYFVPQFHLTCLTWEGHEFLDAARDETRWRKAKERLTAAGGFSLLILKDLLVEIMKKQMGP